MTTFVLLDLAMSIKNLPMIGKVLIIIGIFGVTAVSSAVFSTSKMREIGKGYSTGIAHEGMAALSLARAGLAINGVKGAIADLLVSTSDEGNRRAFDALEHSKADFIRFMDTSDVADSSASADTRNLKTQGLQVIDTTCQKVIALAKVATEAAAVLGSQAEFLQSCSPALDKLIPAVSEAANQAIAKQDRIAVEMAALTDSSVTITYGVILGALALVVFGAVFAVQSWISRPIRALTATMSRLAGGDLDVSIVGSERKDEIGPMARALVVFKESGVKLKASEREAERLRIASEQQRSAADAERARAAAQLADVVQGLAAGLEQLSAGALVFRIEEAFAPEYEKLRTDFNDAMSKLADTISVVAANTAAIRSGTGEISSASDDLSRRTEQQAASLEETAAALDEITATVKKTSDGSTHARAVVGSAKADAEHSGEVVARAVEAMSAIETSARKVSQIIGVIDEIAFQTNLLALNAGVEAARAGEAGRGFAVVASEVRGLAQRSAEAAKEIKALISESGRQVGEGVALVGETGKALQRIVVQITEIKIVVSDISTSTQEQATALQEVNTAINQMDQVTQQNAAMVEESTAASHSLAKEADDLARLVSRFDIGETSAKAASVTSSRLMARGAQKPVRPVQTVALKTIGRSGAAAQVQPATNSDWQEF